MSLASARKGRRNNRRGSDSELAPSTIRLVGQFRSEIYAALGELPVGSFEIFVDCLSSPEVGEFIDLDAETLSIPDGETIARGPIPVFKYQLFHNRRDVLAEGYVTLNPEDVVFDWNQARTSTESEIRAALDYEPEPIKPPKPVAPTYKTIPRQPGDSFLGFTVGEGNENIKLGGITIQAFHLPSPMIVGRIRVSLDFRPLAGDKLQLAIYTATGNCVLQTEMTSPENRFDQVRLPAGDLMIAIKPSSALAGIGAYDPPNSAVLPTLPERPVLNDLLWQESTGMEPGIRIGIPRFTLSAQ